MKKISLLIILLSMAFQVHACMNWHSTNQCPRDCGKKETCCQGQGGISYCDSSAGRYVCQHGGYSSCYCTRHAVMDVQHIEGCCLWQGGVKKMTTTGLIICNSGSISEMCSRQLAKKPRKVF